MIHKELQIFILYFKCNKLKDIKLSKIMLKVTFVIQQIISTIESLCQQNLNNEHLKVESITQLSIEKHNRRDSTFYSPPVAVLPELARAFAWNPDLTKKTEKDLEWVGGTALDVFAHL